MTEDDFVRLQGRAAAEVDDAVKFAEAGEIEPLAELERFIYAERAA
jgi:hypothetical protein